MNRLLTEFRGRSIRYSIKQWSRELWALCFPYPISGEGKASVTAFGVGGPGGSSVLRAGDRSIESRLQHLEEDVATLRANLGSLVVAVDRNRQALEKALRAEEERRGRDLTALREKLDSLALGDLYWEFIGVCWLMIASLMQGFPRETLRLLL